MTSQHSDGEGGVIVVMAFCGLAELVLLGLIYCGYVWLAS